MHKLPIKWILQKWMVKRGRFFFQKPVKRVTPGCLKWLNLILFSFFSFLWLVLIANSSALFYILATYFFIATDPLFKTSQSAKHWQKVIGRWGGGDEFSRGLKGFGEGDISRRRQPNGISLIIGILTRPFRYNVRHGNRVLVVRKMRGFWFNFNRQYLSRVTRAEV